jgi:hypothetical protein
MMQLDEERHTRTVTMPSKQMNKNMDSHAMSRIDRSINIDWYKSRDIDIDSYYIPR